MVAHVETLHVGAYRTGPLQPDRITEQSKGGSMDFAPGPAGPARYPGRRGERQTENSLDPCPESRLPGWALPQRCLLGVGQWFEPDNGCRLGPPHGPRPWFALFWVVLKRHQKTKPDNLKPHPVFSALLLERPLPLAIVAPATLRRWLLAVPSQYTPVPQGLHRPVVRYSACTFGQCPMVQLAPVLCPRGHMALKTRGSAKRKEPRPPIRVEALLPRWAQVTQAASAISDASQVWPWTVASTLASAQSDLPTTICERRNVVWQTTFDYPFEPIPPSMSISMSERCANGSAPCVALHLRKRLYQVNSARTSSKGTLFHLYLWAMSFRTIDFWNSKELE
jgi:hypothetical protein